MTFWILSRFKINAFEDAQSDFIPDDLIESIHDADTRIVTDPSLLAEMIREHPNLIYHYKITLSREACPKVSSLSPTWQNAQQTK
jgi:hypothetical protein